MSTGLAPPALPSAQTGQGQKEWLDSVSASTPSSTHVPGNFPETPPTTGKSLEEIESKQLEAQSRSDSQLKTVTAMVDKPPISSTPAVHNEVGRTVEDTTPSVKNTVSPYGSPEDDEEDPHVSLPSTELKGAQPSEHTGGVGALPGNVSESSVALLPDEREETDEGRQTTSARQRGETIKPCVSSRNDETRSQEPENEETKIPSDVSPSKNDPSASQALGISGTDVESQKELSKTENQDAADQGNAVDVVGSSAAEAATGAEGPETGTEGSKLPLEELGPGKNASGYGGDYHPAQLHPPPPGASVAEYQSRVDDNQQAEHGSPTTATQEESVGSEKKPRFITVVKGEMKILAGKMSRDEQKVQEGKKLVHGET